MDNDILDALSYSMRAVATAAYRVTLATKEMCNAFIEFTNTPLLQKALKERKKMELKLLLLETRLHTLEGRNTECEAIRKKLRRQIRNLKAAIAA